MLRHIIDAIKGKHPLTSKRSSEWPKVRKAHLELHSTCAVCGGKDKLQVHHVRPFHVHPELELDPLNLITLCESKKHGINCHLFVGHLGNFKQANEEVQHDALTWLQKMLDARAQLQDSKHA